jgi:hypothetical protein
MLSHALWALGITILALGVAALLRAVPALRRGLAGYLGAGVLGLGVLAGLQWVTWAYVDVQDARDAECGDVVLDAIVVPFGAGHLLTYAILPETGIALFGWALRRTEPVPGYVAAVGAALGAFTVLAALSPLLAAAAAGSDGHMVFDVATLLPPVPYPWATAGGIATYRRR